MIFEVEHSEYVPASAGRLVLLLRGLAWSPVAQHAAPPTLRVRTAGGEWRYAAAEGSHDVVTDPSRWVRFTLPFVIDAALAAADPDFALEPGVARRSVAPAAPPAPSVDPSVLDRLEDAAAELQRVADTLPGLEAQVERLADVVRARRAAAAAARASAPPAPATTPRPAVPVAVPAQPSPAAVPAAPTPLPAPRPAPASPVPRPSRRRLRPTLPAAIFVVGSLAVADAALTVVWKEPVSSLYQWREQRGLADDLEQLDVRLGQVRVQLPEIPSPQERMAALAARLDRDARAGDPLGRLEIPRLGKRFVFVHGTGDDELRSGPGHYSTSPLPGGRGTVGIAGHRTTYGAPFRDVDQLRRGDVLRMRMPYGDFEYAVEGTRIVKPSETSVLRTVRRDRLVLTACHPLYSAKERIIVFSELRRATPKGPALDLGTTPA